MTEIVAKGLLEYGREIHWTQIKLTRSDSFGKPSCEKPLPLDSSSPVNQLMFDQNGAELPPIVFYEILESPLGVFSNKRTRAVDAAEESLLTKKFKSHDESVCTVHPTSSSHNPSFSYTLEKSTSPSNRIASSTVVSSLATCSPESNKTAN